MKKILKKVSFLLIALLIFTSCSDEKVGNKPKKIVGEIDIQPEKEEAHIVDTTAKLTENEKPKVVAPKYNRIPKGWGDDYRWMDSKTEIEPPVKLAKAPRPPAIYDSVPVEKMKFIDPDFKGITLDPEYPGGVRAMKKFLSDNIVYPEIDQELGNQGSVYVQFVIEKDGSVSNVEVARGVSNTLDQEAIRIISAMPKWKPAESDREPVRCKLRYPIIFTLQ